ncbi:MAG: FAD-dependent oxidoreductase, partial [Nitrospinota bacterium]
AKNIPCQSGCPVSTNIPAYIRALYEKNFDTSYLINRASNIFPGVLGRICSRPCEVRCRHGEGGLGEAVNICHIKRGAADFSTHATGQKLPKISLNGKKVAIVGSGPAGLASASELALFGFAVTIFEAMEVAGGMLRYGIPEFRLPHSVLKEEVDFVRSLGVSIECNSEVGVDPALPALLKEFDCTVLAAGCMTPLPLGAPGEELKGVYSGLEFMVQVESGKPPRLGKRVVVIGAGFTAFDCARTALRTGGEDVSICMRLTERDIVVTKDEIMGAKLEGVQLRGLLVSKRIVGETSVEGVEFLRTKPGGTTPQGKKTFSIIEGSEFVLPADAVIVATGQRPRPIDGPAKKNERGLFEVDSETFKTSLPNLYMAGDYKSGPSTVIQAIASGREAARQIIRDFTNTLPKEKVVRFSKTETTDRKRLWDFTPREQMPCVDPSHDRATSMKIEVETGFTEETAVEESKRCYLCYLHYEIDISRCIYCRYCIDVAPRDCIKMVESITTDEKAAINKNVETKDWQNVNAIMIDNQRCIRCGECMRVCPVDCISVTRVELVEKEMKEGPVT